MKTLVTDTASFPLKRTEIGGVPITTIAKKFGTPTFIYNSSLIKERLHNLNQFDVVRYAQKANSHLTILNVIKKQGGLVDSVSAGEILRALKVGFSPQGDPPPIVYTADIFDHDALDLVVKHKIHCCLGSPDMIEQLGKRAPGSAVTLRINPGFGHGHSQKTNTGGEQSKHGIWHEELLSCVEKAKINNLTITGLHMHIGSGTDLEHLSKVCHALKESALQVGESIHTISAGGGLPTPYQAGETSIDIQSYYQLWDTTRKELEKEWGHSVTLEIEPGRFICAESGYLLCEIRAIKKMGANTFYLVDAGFNNLARPILYGAYHHMSLCTQNPSNELQSVIVGGPLCESGDIFTQEEGGYVCRRGLPLASVGDYLIIESAGAYCSVMASNYNSKPLAAEVWIEEGEATLISKRQSYEEFLEREKIV